MAPREDIMTGSKGISDGHIETMDLAELEERELRFKINGRMYEKR